MVQSCISCILLKSCEYMTDCAISPRNCYDVVFPPTIMQLYILRIETPLWLKMAVETWKRILMINKIQFFKYSVHLNIRFSSTIMNNINLVWSGIYRLLPNNKFCNVTGADTYCPYSNKTMISIDVLALNRHHLTYALHENVLCIIAR